MKSTTVRELRNNYSQVLKWVAKGEEVEVTRRGKAVAKVVPVTPQNPAEVDWSKSAALSRKHWAKDLTADQSAAILAESQGADVAIVVADTSFLFSLFGADAHTAAARGWAVQAKQHLAITALTHYEFGNALRFAAFRQAISPQDALNSLAAFESDLKRGLLRPVASDLGAIVKEAGRLSELHTITGGHRSFDILHVATARVVKATLFLSFDVNQRKLASTLKLIVGP